MANFTQAQLAALREAYATGALTVEYDGKRVTYNSGAELKARIREIENDLAGTTSRSRISLAGFRRA
jgi:hypothetical protein